MSDIFEVVKMHATRGYQRATITYTREEIREIFGTDKSSLVSVLLNALEDAEETIKAVEHIHVCGQDGTDGCNECGLDLRNPIHKRNK